jgi:glycosyltransferase involved in cell wall biosynthesis
VARLGSGTGVMRVLHVRSGQGLYGAERALLALAQATPAPFQPRVASLVRPGRGDPLGEATRRIGLEAVRIDTPGRISLRAIPALARAVGRGGLLHAHDYKSLVLSVAAAPLARAVVVATFHGDTAASSAVRGYEALARYTARWTAAVAATSEPLSAGIRAAAPRVPVHVIPNGIGIGTQPDATERREARRDLELPEDVPVVAFVGRLSPEKGPAILLQALAGSGAVGLFAGDGPLRSALEEQAAGRPVRFLGFVEDARPVLAAADLLCLPSLTEGLPLAALEAMVAGCPVVASAVGALPDVLGDGAGVLVPPGDVGALQAALRHLAFAPGEREKIARTARARVEGRFSAEAMARAYVERIYTPALEAIRGVGASRPELQPR